MNFNFRLFSSVVRHTLFKTRGTHARLTPKRIAVLAFITPLFFLMESANWVGFLLDDILFRAYRRQEIRQPVFIIGPPRSGTTYLQRLLAADGERFTSMKTWEIFFAPSITQKKIVELLGRIDSRFGSPLYRLLRIVDERIYREFSKIHPASLFEAEEDGLILLHVFSSPTAFFTLPVPPLEPYFFFDQQVDARLRRRILAFYKRCVRCHLYVFGPDKTFLSKNPMFSTMVLSLNDAFPDSKFVYLARTPYETVPSTVSMLSFCFNSFMSPLEPHPYLQEQMDILLQYYMYPLEAFTALPESRRETLLYTELVANPEQTARALYRRFGMVISPAYALTLRTEQEKATRYRSQHAYSLEKFGLTPEKIAQKFDPVFVRFGFARQPAQAVRTETAPAYSAAASQT